VNQPDYCHSLQKVVLMTGILILFGKRVGFEIGVRQQNLQSKRYINPFAKHAEQANLHYAILRKSYRVQFAKTSFKMH
jgi:hypothetical protein